MQSLSQWTCDVRLPCGGADVANAPLKIEDLSDPVAQHRRTDSARLSEEQTVVEAFSPDDCLLA
jgi:hypothetical protein